MKRLLLGAEHENYVCTISTLELARLAATGVIFGLFAFALPVRYLVAPAVRIVPFMMWIWPKTWLKGMKQRERSDSVDRS